MAYQPKSYKKFVATAATATLVATAVVPAAFADEVKTSAFSDVPASYEAAIDFVVKNSFSKGLNETTYGIGDSIKRGDAAIIIANAAGLNDKDAPSAGFGDVPTRGALAINSLKAAGVVNGKTATNFGFGDSITRGEAAIMLQRAFDLKAGDTKVTFSDVSDRYQDAVAALVAKDVTKGINATQFGTQNPIKRGDFAKFIYALRDLIELPEAPAAITVGSVKATNPTTVELTGTNLNNLVASNVQVVGKTLNTFTPAADGKSLSFTVTEPFAPGQEYTVRVTANGETKDYKFVFAYSPSDAAIVTSTIDDDMDKQYITFSMSGSLGNIEYLTNVLGYEVEFQATEDVFVGPNGTGVSNVSTTGEIAEEAAAVVINEEFEVKVVLTKDGVVTQSAFSTVRVVNLNATPQIGSLVLENVGANGNQTPNAGSNDFVMNSTTLVTGETGAITGLRSATGQIINISGTPTFTSSNPGVATVVPTGTGAFGAGTIQAISPGQTTITVKAGTETFTLTLTVTGDARELSTGVIADASLKFAQGAERDLAFVTRDQYGDAFAIAAGDVAVTSTDEDILGATLNLDGTVTVEVEDDAPAGNYTIYFRDVENDTLLDSINVEVTTGNTVDVTKTQLQLAASTSASNIGSVLNINEYTVDGGFLGTEVATAAATSVAGGDTVAERTIAVGAYTVTVADGDVAQVSVAANSDAIVVTGLEEGSTDITVRSADGISRATYRVTVEDDSVRVTAVNFLKPATVIAAGEEISVLDLLDIEVVAGDDIVKGLTLNTTTSSFVRIADTDAVGATDAIYANAFYLDVNDDGQYDATNDVYLGSLNVTENPGSTLAETPSLADLNDILTTTAGDEGQLIFTFVADADAVVGLGAGDKVLTGTTTVNIKVPTPVTP